ncbi:hypothetical protein ATN84_16640 [Paramesorhizobium deserti]|uniref:Uncharacterized protein n=1 Tax=Paramesorhizobium deserti TaxID=1494590 RepID=A0A135HQZ5_9HYPH|nr:hypothetical protein [Paramesorhizobium deserti]KXF75618.1 hypothetical protein ATN84_16640 [Paramesorhizobium deserti]
MSRATSAGLIALGAAAGLILSLIAYTTRSSGINGTGGALLVIASSAAILLAAMAIAMWPKMRGWLRGTLIFLLLLGILGTALAAYFLDSKWLLLAMAVCLIGWLLATRHQDAPASRGARTVKGKATS